MMSTELRDVRFKVKEGLPDPYSLRIDAEPQSMDGALPGGIAGLEFLLHTKDLEEAEKIAKFLNEEVSQIFIKPKEAK
jgi:hypothetical protein